MDDDRFVVQADPLGKLPRRPLRRRLTFVICCTEGSVFRRCDKDVTKDRWFNSRRTAVTMRRNIREVVDKLVGVQFIYSNVFLCFI